MAGFCKVMIIGRVGKDPEFKKINSGQSVANFSLACTEKFKDRNGQPQEKTEWINCIAWGKVAEIIQQYVKKGGLIYVDGKLQTTSWDDATSGQKRYKTEVNVSQLQMLGGKSEQSAPSQEPNQYDQYSQPSQSYNPVPDSDLPF